VRHIDYLIDRPGRGGVAVGSEFDGAVIPGVHQRRERLVAALHDHGYNKATLSRFAMENWLRIFA
jgi:membrane dipeptidase